jgi:hypothetical protein
VYASHLSIISFNKLVVNVILFPQLAMVEFLLEENISAANIFD